MQIGQPSNTAIATASMRAAHLCFYDGPYIHEDPFAVQLAANGSVEDLRKFLERRGYSNLRRVCAFFALRHRFSEDRMQAALARGVRQIVLLGAGLDSFALRHSRSLQGRLYVEVDHPDSQRWKLERLAELGFEAPGVTYLPLDFARQDLGRELGEAGVRLSEPTFFQWLGVSQYIPQSAVCETLSIIARHAPGSEVVLDMILPLEGLEGEDLAISIAARGAATSRGEPWITFFEPMALGQRLKEMGFEEVIHLAPPSAGAIYYGGQPALVTPLIAWQLMAGVVGDTASGRARP